MATLGSLIVKIGADIKDFTSGLDRVAKSTGDLGKFTATAADVAGKALTVMGAAATGVGVNATRMAMDFESSFAGVKKTTDATKEEFAALSQGLRDLAQEVPVSVNELNRIAETGGALGVAKEALVDFTKTIAMVATSSNLTADNAANSFARIGNVMGLTAQDFGRMGAAVIDLGNKGASTETDITEMAMRIAGAANAIGMSARDVLALAAAMSDVGIEAEMGGSAISRLMIKIAADVNTGSDDIKSWADIAGVSAQQFAQSFKTDPAAAIDAFVQGLARVKAEGGDLFGTLESLDIKEIRLRDTVLRLAGAKDGLAKSLENARTAWDQNTALTTEAGKRYETSASQLQIFQNRLSDTQITLGTALIPVLMQALDLAEPLIQMLKSWADGFAALDPTTQTFIAAVTGLSAVLYPAIIALAGFTRAVQTLIPLVTSLWGVIMAHPFVAIGVAVAALAVAVVMNWDKIVKVIDGWAHSVAGTVDRGLVAVQNAFTAAHTAILGTVKALVTGIQDWLSNKLAAIFGKVNAGIEEVKGYFRGLYDAVVGHSYIPDMVEEIGDHMRNLDVTMTAPARNAVVNTGRVIEGGTLSWGSTINQFASTANQTWGGISQTFASNLARMTVETVQWGEVFKQMGVQLLQNFITTSMGIVTQWVLTEAGKTAAAQAGASARTAIATEEAIAEQTIMAQSGSAVTTMWESVGQSTIAVGKTALEVLAQITDGVMGIINAIADALTFTGILAPVGMALKGITSMLSGQAGGISSALGGFLDGVDFGWIDNIKEFFGFSSMVNLDAMPSVAFASGGIVTGPTRAIMGEAGSPEAAIPLNSRGAAFMQQAMGLGGGGNTTIIFEEDGRRTATYVMQNMQKVYRQKRGNR